MNKTGIALSEKQRASVEDWKNPDIREIFYEGGARSGKTFVILLRIVQRAILYPGSRHLLARYRLNHLVTSLWMQSLIPLLNKLLIGTGTFTIDKQYLIVNLWNGSSIWGTGLDDQDRVEKIMGTEFSTIFINEATQISYSTYQKVKTRLSQIAYNEAGKPITRKIVLDCNPRNENHWIYRFAILKQNPNQKGEPLQPDAARAIQHRKWFPWDNPYLPKDTLEILKSLSGAERQRLYEGQWVNQEGLVYPGYQDAIVEPFEIPPGWPISGSVDFGYTNPFVFLWFAFDKTNEILYLFDELYEAGKLVSEHCKTILQRRRLDGPVITDHDAEDRATMESMGIRTKAAKKDVSLGIQTVTEFLSAKVGFRVRIFSSCVSTIEEISTYSWEEPTEGKSAKESPVKHNDHAMDALRYRLMEYSRTGFRPSVVAAN